MIKKSMVIVMRNLYRRGLISVLSGNISVRIPNTDHIWITPSGIYKAKIRAQDLVKIDLNGNIIEGCYKPSIEWRMHVAVYKVRSDVSAIVHTHNPYVLILDLLGIDMDLSLLIESRHHVKGLAYIPEIEPGSEMLAKYVAEKASTGIDILILKRHGVVTLGRDIYEAQALTEILEDLAKVQLYTSIIKTLMNIVKMSYKPP